jgi:hypothetical protein
MPSDPKRPPTIPLQDQDAIRQRVQRLEQEHPDRYADLQRRFQQARAHEESVELERFKRTIDLVEYAKKAGYEVRASETMGGVTVLAHPNEDRIAVAQNSRGQWAYASLNQYAPPLPNESQAHVWRRLRDAIARTEDKGTIVEFTKTREGERSLDGVRQRLRQASQELHPAPPREPHDPLNQRGVLERTERGVAWTPDGDRLRKPQERPMPAPSGPTRPAPAMPTPVPRDETLHRDPTTPEKPGGERGVQDRLRRWREGIEASVQTHLRRAPSDPQRAADPGSRPLAHPARPMTPTPHERSGPTPTQPSAPARRGHGPDRGR